jgi:hypothetical protein
MINKVGAASGETVRVTWPITSLGAVVGELPDTHVHLDVVHKNKTVQHYNNLISGVRVDHTDGDASVDVDTKGLPAGEYVLMSFVQRPNGTAQRKIVRYLTLY